MDFKALMVPGEGNKPDDPSSWRPRGQCHGVIYYDAAKGRRPQNNEPYTTHPSLECRALAYLKPPSDWWRVKHPAGKGVMYPLWQFLQKRFPKMAQEAREAEPPRKLVGAFCVSESSAHCNTAKYRDRWHIEKAEEGIWCVFLLPEAKKNEATTESAAPAAGAADGLPVRDAGSPVLADAPA